MTRVSSRVLFPTEEPLSRKRMIGRKEDVRELTAQLSAGVHRIVAAPRRTGKSSLCNAVIEELQQQGKYVVCVSLFRSTNAADLAESIARAALCNRKPLARLVKRMVQAGEAVLKGTALTLAVKTQTELGEGAEIVFTPGYAHNNPSSALIKAFELLQKIAERDEKQLVFFIDEFQEIASSKHAYGDPDAVTSQLREILHSSPNVTCLFAGSIEHMMRDLFTNNRRALAGFGGFHKLTPILVQEWKAGLTERFSEDGCTVTLDAIHRMIDRGALHPRSTMLIAQQTHIASLEEETKEIDIALAERGFQGAMLSDHTRHVDLFEHIRSINNIALRLATRLASNQPPYSGFEQKKVRITLEKLASIGILNRGPQRGEWNIADPLLSTYLKNH